MDQIRSLIDSITVADVITWAVVVLVAGFIGQFGRKFAEHLIEKARGKEQKPPRETKKIERAGSQTALSTPARTDGRSLEKTDAVPTPLKDDKAAKERSKIEKKAAKALLKQKKKAASSD